MRHFVFMCAACSARCGFAMPLLLVHAAHVLLVLG